MAGDAMPSPEVTELWLDLLALGGSTEVLPERAAGVEPAAGRRIRRGRHLSGQRSSSPSALDTGIWDVDGG